LPDESAEARRPLSRGWRVGNRGSRYPAAHSPPVQPAHGFGRGRSGVNPYALQCRPPRPCRPPQWVWLWRDAPVCGGVGMRMHFGVAGSRRARHAQGGYPRTPCTRSAEAGPSMVDLRDIFQQTAAQDFLAGVQRLGAGAASQHRGQGRRYPERTPDQRFHHALELGRVGGGDDAPGGRVA